MATSTESFLDPAKLSDELKNVLRGSKLPGIDVDALVASERKNVEAVTEASRATFESMQAIGKRQIEIFQETMNEATKAYDALTRAGSPPEVVAKETDIAKEAFKKRPQQHAGTCRDGYSSPARGHGPHQCPDR